MKNILIPLADGFEEIEAATCINVFRRAGLSVITAGMPGTMVKGSRGVKMMADRRMDDVNMNQFDVLVLVGGDPGFRNLGRSQKILKAVRDFGMSNKLIGAICAAPVILARVGLIEKKLATVYPGMEREIPRPRGGRVIVDGNVITSQAPGTAMEFALKIVETLLGAEKANELRSELVC